MSAARGGRTGGGKSLRERILLGLSRDPGAPDFAGGTDTYTLDNALDFHRKTLPGFLDLIRGRMVLDYGCGPGWQACAMVRAGAAHVLGVDIYRPWLAHARSLAAAGGCADRAEFVHALDETQRERFDVSLSSNSFEHFADPAGVLETMRRATRPGGAVVIAFAEPWLSPRGSHMNFFTRVPWVNLLFPEDVVMRVRARYRDDGATRYEDVASGLNRMTLRKFEGIIRASGMRVEFLRYYPVKGLPLVDRIPALREFLVGAVACVLRTP